MEKGTAVAYGPRFTLLLLWLFLTVFNLNKAYHIDDTFHLEAAEWIKDHPSAPMSGFINWDQTAEPLHAFNQPPLFFFMVAGIMQMAGSSEIVMHLFLSIFTFLCLYFFSRIAELLSLKHKNLLLFFFAFNPAFIVNQNLMTDVPLLSLILGFAFFILRASTSAPLKNYFFAAIFAGLSCLIKYSALPLLPLLLVIILIRRHYRVLALVLIPIGFLVLWSVWNYYEFGTIHIFGRHKEPPQLKHLFDFVNCLGAVSLFSVPFIQGLFPFKWMRWMLVTLIIVSLLLITLAVSGIIPMSAANQALNIGFIVNGATILSTLLIKVLKKLADSSMESITESPFAVVVLIATALSAFIVLFAPFIATRHLLLVIPFLLLMGDKWMEELKGTFKGVVVGLTVLSGVTLGSADWQYADYYRDMADEIKLPKNSNVWYAGHWGWQWYAGKNGWKQYDAKNTNLNPGDYLIYPQDISQQTSNKNGLLLLEKKWSPSPGLQFISVSAARLYSSGIDQAPWQLSKEPVDTVCIYRLPLNKF